MSVIMQHIAPYIIFSFYILNRAQLIKNYTKYYSKNTGRATFFMCTVIMSSEFQTLF